MASTWVQLPSPPSSPGITCDLETFGTSGSCSKGGYSGSSCESSSESKGPMPPAPYGNEDGIGVPCPIPMMIWADFSGFSGNPR